MKENEYVFEVFKKVAIADAIEVNQAPLIIWAKMTKKNNVSITILYSFL